jgi:hypothetical protein
MFLILKHKWAPTPPNQLIHLHNLYDTFAVSFWYRVIVQGRHSLCKVYNVALLMQEISRSSKKAKKFILFVTGEWNERIICS